MRNGILHFTYSGEEFHVGVQNILEKKDIILNNYYEIVAHDALKTAMKMEPKIINKKGTGCYPFNIWLDVDGVTEFKIESFQKI